MDPDLLKCWRIEGAHLEGRFPKVVSLEWLRKVDEHLDTLYVHCQAGKHRGVGGARIIAER